MLQLNLKKSDHYTKISVRSVRSGIGKKNSKKM